MLHQHQTTTAHGTLVHHGHHQVHQGHHGHHGQQGHRNVQHGQQGHRNVQHGHQKSHGKPNATFGFYKAIFFWVVLFGLGWLAQHAYEQYAQPASDEGPILSVSPYGDVRVWREQVDDLAIAATKWLQEAQDPVEHHRRTTVLLVKLQQGNEDLIVLRADVRSDNYAIWAAKLKQLWKLMPMKPVPGSKVAIEIETLVHKLVNGMFWLKREALYT